MAHCAFWSDGWGISPPAFPIIPLAGSVAPPLAFLVIFLQNFAPRMHLPLHHCSPRLIPNSYCVQLLITKYALLIAQDPLYP